MLPRMMKATSRTRLARSLTLAGALLALGAWPLLPGCSTTDASPASAGPPEASADGGAGADAGGAGGSPDAGAGGEAGAGGAAGGGAGAGGAAGAGGGSAKPSWQTVFDEASLDRAALSSWGSSPSNVFVVGGSLGNGGDALVLRFDGDGWQRLAPGGEDSLWWVHGTGPSDVWMVGEHGRIVHFDGASFVEHPRPTTATLWGVFAAGPADVWTVGGSPGKGAGALNDLCFHFDGSSWKQEAFPGDPRGATLFKVWSPGGGEVYAVGEGATIWHRKAGAWALEPAPAKTDLRTVSGCSATEVYAVGGSNVLRSDGQTWTKVNVDVGGIVNGVACNAPGEVLIVGSGGMKQRLSGGTWIDEFTVPPYVDLHSAWADGQGNFWAAGGDFISPAAAGKPRTGAVARFGAVPVPTKL